MSLASVLEAICQEYGIYSKATFIEMLEDDEEAASMAEFARKSVAVAAEQHVEQAAAVAAEQAAHVEEVLRLQMEIRTLAVDIGIQEQIVAGLMSTADRAAADHSAGCAKAERAAAART